MSNLLTLLRSQLGRAAGFIFLGLGVVVLLIGYHGVSTSAYMADQLTYVVSGGIVGLFLLGLAATLLISSELHDDWRKLSHVEEAIDELRLVMTKEFEPDASLQHGGGREAGVRPAVRADP